MVLLPDILVFPILIDAEKSSRYGAYIYTRSNINEFPVQIFSVELKKSIIRRQSLVDLDVGGRYLDCPGHPDEFRNLPPALHVIFLAQDAKVTRCPAALEVRSIAMGAVACAALLLRSAECVRE